MNHSLAHSSPPIRALGGALDTTFNATGYASLGMDYEMDLAMQADGKIVVTGMMYGADSDTAVARINVGTQTRRLYPTHDANFNITSLLDASGNTVERYTYLPYGERAVFDASMNVRSSSAYNFTHGHQGGSHDLITGLIHFRHREYSTALGRWVQQDPERYVDGMSMYQAYGTAPCDRLDPMGLDYKRWIGMVKSTCQLHTVAAKTTQWTYFALVPGKTGDAGLDAKLRVRPGTKPKQKHELPSVQNAMPQPVFFRFYLNLYKCCDCNGTVFWKYSEKPGVQVAYGEPGKSGYTTSDKVMLPVFIMPLNLGFKTRSGTDYATEAFTSQAWHPDSNVTLEGGNPTADPSTAFFLRDDVFNTDDRYEMGAVTCGPASPPKTVTVLPPQEWQEVLNLLKTTKIPIQRPFASPDDRR